MPVTTIVDLVQELSLGALLTPPQRQELAVLQTSFTDLRLLARELVKLGWLTPYQVNQVVQGRARELLLGPYVLLERLGEGGMGQVFKARHTFLNRPVALKLIGQEHLRQRGAAERFLKEMQLVAQLDHPHIVRALDAGQADQRYYLAMELIEGPTLSRLVQQRGPLAVPQACACIYQAALGLQHAHERGLVHRDIKPSNLMLATPPGGPPQVKILDLGLARLQGGDPERELTRTGTTMGTLDYLAPEQALDPRKVDVRADLYSLGCTFYFLLAGRPPFDGETDAQKLLQHQKQEPPTIQRADLSAATSAVLRRLLAKRPEQRYQTPAALALALQPFAAGVGDVRATGIAPFVGAELPSLAERPATAPQQGFTLASEPSQLSPRAGSKTSAALPESPPSPWTARLRNPRALAAGLGALVLCVLVLWLILRPTASTQKDTQGQVNTAPPPPPQPVWKFLSDLDWVETKDGPWPVAKNGRMGDPENRSIVVNGVTSPKGLGMHPPHHGYSSVRYRLKGNALRFKAGFGFDDSTTRVWTPIVFEVLGDGRSLWRSEPTQALKTIRECEVLLEGIESLELRIHCPRLHIGAHAVWLEPRVLMKAEEPSPAGK